MENYKKIVFKVTAKKKQKKVTASAMVWVILYIAVHYIRVEI
jgi:hypothetical protein